MSYYAKILADSVAPHGKRLTTFEVSMPKFIQAELNTHRMLSRNSASSRAIPFEKFVKQVVDDPVLPVWWGKNQSGMQANEELSSTELTNFKYVAMRMQPPHGMLSAQVDELIPNNDRDFAKRLWLSARDTAVSFAEVMHDIGVHKQIVNRVLEPWIFTTVIVSATEWDNFFKLRCHKDAQPEFRHVALMMQDAYKSNKPTRIQRGDWHLPLIDVSDRLELSIDALRGPEAKIAALEYLCKVSVGRCARVSYLTHDGKRDMNKDVELCQRLMTSGHWSPFEHVATPAVTTSRVGNYIGWTQFRATVDPDFLW